MKSNNQQKNDDTKSLASSSSEAYTKNKSKNHAAPLVAGFMGGAVSTVLLYPLDLVKVRLQVSEAGGRRSTQALSQNTIPRRKFVRTLFGIIKHEGGAALYQGLMPGLVGSSVSWGGYFFFYEKIKHEVYLRRNHNDTSTPLSSWETFGVSCLAGGIMVGFTNPIWLIKTRMQLQPRLKSQDLAVQVSTRQYTGMIDAAKTIVAEEGALALYKGAVPALLLTSHGGVQFVCYEYLKTWFGEYKKTTRPKGQSITISQRLHDSCGYLTMGAVSKIMASTSTYPIQVIKSRLQQRSKGFELVEHSSTGKLQVISTEHTYKGILDCIKRILVNEGPAGFFKGCLPNALRVAPSSAITFVTYEAIMDAFT